LRVGDVDSVRIGDVDNTYPAEIMIV
jgi:hypothetical protein